MLAELRVYGSQPRLQLVALRSQNIRVHSVRRSCVRRDDPHMPREQLESLTAVVHGLMRSRAGRCRRRELLNYAHYCTDLGRWPKLSMSPAPVAPAVRVFPSFLKELARDRAW